VNRRAQLLGHVFVFLLGAFVVGAIMLIGYRAIANLNEQQCAVQEREFVRDVSAAFESSMRRGSERSYTFSLPCGATQACFVARSALDTQQAESSSADRAIITGIESGDTASVYVEDRKGFRKVDGLDSLPIANFGEEGTGSVDCFSGDIISVRLIGRGLSVAVESDNV
jgi:hypothetical protein